MADGYMTATMAALRAPLVADATVSALVGDRIVDDPPAGLDFPYVRFGRMRPVTDDTDGTTGSIVQVGLEVRSRPLAGRVEAARICEAIQIALHRAPDDVTVSGYDLCEIEVQDWFIEPGPDPETHQGRMALEVHLDA